MSDKDGAPARMRLIAAPRNLSDTNGSAETGVDQGGAVIVEQGRSARSILLPGFVFILGSALGGAGAALWLL